MGRLVVLLYLLWLGEAWKTYDGYRTYKVTPQSEGQLIQLYNVISSDPELDVWKQTRGVGIEAHIMVPAEKCDQFVGKMVEGGLEVNIHVSNVGDRVAEYRQRMDERKLSEEIFAFNVSDYNNLNDTYDQLEVWLGDCPEGVVCELQSIGQSYEGREILMFSMSTGEPREIIYMDALTHPREQVPGVAINNIINRMVYEYGSDENVTYMLNNYDWYFVPVVNPDGLEFMVTEDLLWRKNRQPNNGSICVGTDPNRNFDTGFWGTDGTSPNYCSQGYPGVEPFSANESRNIADMLRDIDPKIVVSMHSYGDVWLQPYGHTLNGTCALTEEPLHTNMMLAGEAAINAIMRVGGQDWWVRGTICTVFYPAAGGTIDYAILGDNTKYSYTPELRGGEFIIPVEDLPIAYEETWAAMVDMVYETERHEA